MCAALAFALAMSAAATTWYVPTQYRRIQAAIDAAAGGDTVLVSDGMYTGRGNRDIDFGGKAVVVMSETGPRATIIDCEGSELDPHRGFHFQSGEDSASVVRGFTIQGGYAEEGGGILCELSSPMIVDNVIRGNVATWGGGIYCGDYSLATISRNTITGNEAEWDGGGIYCYFHSRSTIAWNEISGNRAYSGAGICTKGASPTIEGNEITANIAGYGGGGGICCNASILPYILGNLIAMNSGGTGGGIYLTHSGPLIDGNTLTGNTALAGGGISTQDSWATVTNSILWGDSADIHPEIYLFPDSVLTVTYSDVEGGWPGQGNRDADPLFVPGPPGDYCLSQLLAGQPEQSPCVNAGDPVSAPRDGTTRTDRLVDTWPTDMGYHYPVNHAPDLVDQTDTMVVENQYLTFTLVASDPDGDDISYSSPELPAGATLDATTGVFEWTPTFVQSGLYTVTFIATDWAVPALTDTERTHITVGNLNRAPDLADQPDTTIAEDEYLTFTLEASDPDGDSISFSSPDLPDGATLDPVTGVFEWTPTYEQAGLYTVTFIAMDHVFPAQADTEQTDITVTDVVGVEEGDEDVLRPLSQYLAQNYPNPFRSTTMIAYSLVGNAPVSIAIYDVRGALVRELVSGTLSAGRHRLVWDGRDGRGQRVGSGVYFCRLEAGEFIETRRMVILR